MTPHTLTEVSNLAGRSLGNRSYNFFRGLATWLDTPTGRPRLEERHRPANLISRDPEFFRLGLTDAMILHLAAHKHALVLTDDAPLGHALSQRGIDVLTLADLVATASP